MLRDADDPYADYPKRIAYLIDPDGTIAAADEVTDPGGYGAEALATLAAAQALTSPRSARPGQWPGRRAAT